MNLFTPPFRFPLAFASLLVFAPAQLSRAQTEGAKEPTGTPAPTAPAAAPTKLTELQILESWGWLSAGRMKLTHAEMSDEEIEFFERGAKLAASGKPSPYDMRRVHAEVERLAQDRQQAFYLAEKSKNIASADAYFAKLATDPFLKTEPSGVVIQTDAAGHGAFPRPGQTVKVHYSGRLVDGTEFIQMGPYDLILAEKRIAPGLYEGLLRTASGGRTTVSVPPRLTDGDEGKMGIPRGSAVIYEIEVSEIKDTSPQDLADSLLPLPPEPESPPPSGLKTPQLIESWGWSIVQKIGVPRLELTEDEAAAFVSGLTKGIRALPPPYVDAAMPVLVRETIAHRQGRAERAAKQKRYEAAEKLFAELRKNPHVVALPDGVLYEILKPGEGPMPKPGQIVIVDYVGKLLDGKIFDRTENEPLHIEVGSVVPGLNEGIQKVNKGGEIKLYLPAALAYGDENASGVISTIPGGSAVIYDIKLLDIEDPK